MIKINQIHSKVKIFIEENTFLLNIYIKLKFQVYIFSPTGEKYHETL